MHFDTTTRVRAELVKAQYVRMPAAFLGSLLGAGGYLVAAHDLIAAWQWMLWGGLMLGQVLARWWLWLAHRRARPAAHDTARWASRAILASGASGCIWALGAWLVLPAEHVDYQLFYLFLITGTVSLSAVACASFRRAFYAYTLPASLSMNVWMLQADDAMMRGIGWIGLACLPLISSYAHHLNRSMVSSLRLHFENVDLLREVTLRKEQAEEASREKSMFLASASHDLRQPLHALTLQSHLLERTDLAPLQTSLLAGMNASIRSMTERFNALLDMSRLDAGVMEVREAPVELHGLFQQLGREHLREARAKQLTLRLRAGALGVRTDPHLLASLLGNLLSNAIRYTDRGGVLVSARPHRNRVLIQVWDTGHGIAADQQRQVFKPFYQVGNAERDRSKGLGLGLAIVQRLGGLLGLPLALRSAPGKGSCFSLWLPAAQVESAQSGHVAHALAGVQPQLIGAMVLVVDNEACIRAAMEILLASWGCRVVTAATPDEAFSKALAMPRSPMLLVCDYRLAPDVTGLQLIDRLRDEFNSRIPALVVTGDAGTDVLQAVHRNGCVLLHKPVDPCLLQQRIRALLSESPELAA